MFVFLIHYQFDKNKEEKMSESRGYSAEMPVAKHPSFCYFTTQLIAK